MNDEDKTRAFDSDAIALSSPSGRMSKKSREDAQERVRQKLFGKEGLHIEGPDQPTEAESMRRNAAQLRDLASRGMKPRAYSKKADELESQADEWESKFKRNQEP